jgi:hypothetical protein
LQANLTRFADGDAAYFYDVVSPLFEKSYAEESAEDFGKFSSVADDTVKKVDCPAPDAAKEPEPLKDGATDEEKKEHKEK